MSRRARAIFIACSAFTLCPSLLQPQLLLAQTIYSASENDTFHTKLCSRLQDSLKKSQFKHKCSTSLGSSQNIQLIQKNASDLAYSQFDIFALKNSMQTDKANLRLIRKDIGFSCLFMVSKNKNLTNLGEVIAQAKDLKVILPPEQSAHVLTFEYLQHVDASGLGQAQNVHYRESPQKAVEEVLSSEDPNAVALFVDLPDPSDELIRSVTQKGGHFIPIIDRTILRQDIAGEKIYFAQETEIANAKWLDNGAKLLTSCTPIVLFTGPTEKISGDHAKKDHEDMIKTINALPVADLQPKQDFMTKLWMGTQAMTSKSLDKIIDASEKARDKARPMVDKARELTGQAIEQGKPILEKAIEDSRPAIDKAKDLGVQATQKIEELSQKAIEKTKPTIDQTIDQTIATTKPYFNKTMNAWRDALSTIRNRPATPTTTQSEDKKDAAANDNPEKDKLDNPSEDHLILHHLTPTRKP